MDEFYYSVLHSLPDNITHHTAGGRCKCPGKTTKESENITHGIGNSQISGSMMFDENVKEFPADDANGMLCDQWSGLL